MIADKKVLGLVIARGGSKGLPGKNLLEIGGISLTGRAVQAGLESKYIDDVIISTDDNDIAEEAEKNGCEIPFMRPAELATDSARSIDVIKHAIETMKSEGRSYDIFVLLQPTTPFRTAQHIDDCLELYVEKNADSVISVTEAEHHPLWMNTLPEDMSMKDFMRPEAENMNRQELTAQYRINGGVYAVSCDYLLSTGKLYSDRSYAYLMDAESSIDIDSELDYKIARFLADE